MISKAFVELVDRSDLKERATGWFGNESHSELGFKRRLGNFQEGFGISQRVEIKITEKTGKKTH